jgi:hypothetical protein
VTRRELSIGKIRLCLHPSNLRTPFLDGRRYSILVIMVEDESSQLPASATQSPQAGLSSLKQRIQAHYDVCSSYYHSLWYV